MKQVNPPNGEEKHRATRVRAWVFILFAFVLLVCGLCAWTVDHFFFIFGPFPPPRGFATEDLLIDDEPFPPGWRTHQREGGPGAEGAEDSAWVDVLMYVDEEAVTVARENILRYDTMRRASVQYRRIGEFYTFNDYYGDWLPPPPEITFTSPYADEWRLACATMRNLETRPHRCTYFARYEEFLLTFDIDVASEDHPDMLYIEYGEVGEVLRAIDERMALYLGLAEGG